jgi:thioesterase domain-containing protein
MATLGNEERLPEVRAVMLGGEEVRSADLDAFRDHFRRDAVFVNVMGSTESSMALHYFADAATTLQHATVPVGYPVESTEVLLLDPYGRTSDFVGDVAIRSRYVAGGYWKRPELAEAFSPDPLDPTLITYRMGDRARRLADGSLEFLGRRDGQVKIRGMRVEIAEIERALAALPDVGQVAVEARAIDGHRELVGYVEPSGAKRPSQREMRAALRHELPEYMIPSAILWLDRLPRTSSDKIDRRALPSPSPDSLTATAIEPQDALEQRLVAIWEEVLSRRPVRVDEDFFDLGGHSLLAARLFDQIWRETGRRIPMSALLEGATIERLASRLREPSDLEGSELVTVQPGGTQPPLFVVPGAGSRVLYLRNIAKYLGPDQPVYALHQRPDGTKQHRIEDLAARYVIALRRIQRSGPYRLLGYSFGGAVAYEIAQQLKAAGQTVSSLTLIDSRCPGQPGPFGRPSTRTLARRTLNQGIIVRRLGLRAGTRYLRVRTSIAGENALASLRDLLDRRLPAVVRPLLWRDRTPEGEREWMAADHAALEAYRAAPYDGRITFIEAEHKATSGSGSPLWQGWAPLVSGGLELRTVPGNHLTVLVEPLAGVTVAVVAETLRRAHEVDAVDGTHENHGLRSEMPAPAPLP